MTIMKRVLIKAVPASIAALAMSAFMLAPAASAAGLTSTQVQAILSLVASFGADSATIANVQASLTGGTPSTSSSANVSGSVGAGSSMPSMGAGMGSAVCAAFTHALAQGSTDVTTGGEVSRLQQTLISAGVLASGSATGFYGSVTAGAVSKFQAQNGLSAVGIVGPATRALLANRCMKMTPGSTPTTGTSASGNASASANLSAQLSNIDSQLGALGNDLGNADDASSQNDNDQ